MGRDQIALLASPWWRRRSATGLSPDRLVVGDQACTNPTGLSLGVQMAWFGTERGGGPDGLGDSRSADSECAPAVDGDSASHYMRSGICPVEPSAPLAVRGCAGSFAPEAAVEFDPPTAW